MKTSFAMAALAVAALALPASAQTVRKVGWSLGYYCGWDQGTTPPEKVNWKAFTHVAHFTVFPTAAGELDLSIGEFTDARCKAAVDAAHANGVKIVICFGGANVADRFKGATSPANIHKFVKNMLDFMRKYGYDGIDTDWEENFDNAQMLAWHKELRDSIDNIVPKPSLTAATGGYFVNNCYFIHPYVEMMNTMSYDIAVGGMTSEMQRYTSKGV